MTRKPKDETTVTEPTTETVLTTKQIIDKMIAKKNAESMAALAAAQKQVEEAESLANLSVDDEVESIIDNIKTIDEDITSRKTAMNEELKPLNEQIEAVKARYDFETPGKLRTENYNALVAKVGEAGAKLLGSGGGSTGTRVGSGRKANVRNLILQEVCDNGMTPEDVATKHDILGNGERAGAQNHGHLVRRHLDLSAKDGDIVKNTDGTYSRA